MCCSPPGLQIGQKSENQERLCRATQATSEPVRILEDSRYGDGHGIVQLVQDLQVFQGPGVITQLRQAIEY